MKTMIRLCIAVVCCMCFFACDMRELCYDHDSHAYKYQVNIVADYEQEWQYPLLPAKDWRENWPDTFNVRYSDLLPILPSGLRVMIYDSLRYDRQNIGRNGGLVYLTELEKSFIICNNNTETIIFNDERKKDTASVTTTVPSVTTRSISRSSYDGNQYSSLKDIDTRTEPDVLFVNYISSYQPISSIKPLDLPVLLKPVVYTYYIRYEFEYGIEHVNQARGALAGMSGTVNLHTQEPGDELVTVMFNAKINSFGVDADVKSFGLPFDQTELGFQFVDGEYTCGLNLEVLLPNGNIKSFEFDITDQIKLQPRGGVIVVKGLRVEDEEALKEGTGFDVNVDGWGEYEDVVLDF